MPFGFEAGDDLSGVHAGFDDFQGDLAVDRLFLLGHVDDAHAAFADLLQEFVGADDGPFALGDRCGIESGCRRLHKTVHLI